MERARITETNQSSPILMEGSGRNRDMIAAVLAAETDIDALQESARAAVRGPRFALFYNRLDRINSLTDNAACAAYIAENFDSLVMVQGAEDPTYAYYAASVAIMGLVLAARPEFRFYGYVHMGTTVEPVYTVADLTLTVKRWLQIGCAGVFLDECEYGFGTTRQRLNAVLDYVHGQKTLAGYVAEAIVNCWDMTDINGDSIDITNNPTGEAARILSTDAVHHESQAINDVAADYTSGGIEGTNGIIHAAFLYDHEAQTLATRARFGCRYYATSTADLSLLSLAKQRRFFDVAQVVAKILGTDGFGFTADLFGASAPNLYACPAWQYDPDYLQYIKIVPAINWVSESSVIVSAGRQGALFRSVSGFHYIDSPALSKVRTVMADADQSVASNAGYVDDLELSFELAPNQSYQFDGLIMQKQAASGGVHWAFGIPTGIVGHSWSYILYNNETFGFNVEAFQSKTTEQAAGGPSFSGAAESVLRLEGCIHNGPNYGKLKFRFGQLSSDAAATIRKAFSYIRLTRI